MNKTLNEILEGNPLLWRGGEISKAKSVGISTGYKALDEILPTGGWPTNALVEIICPRWGIGELQLLLPALASVSQKSRRLIWIAPPFVPYAPGLLSRGVVVEQMIVIPSEQVSASALWSMEKVLKTQRCGIAMGWPKRLQDKNIRRLQLAAEAGNSLGFLFRMVEVRSSVASLRIRVNPVVEGLKVEVIKSRGGVRFKSVILDL